MRYGDSLKRNVAVLVLVLAASLASSALAAGGGGSGPVPCGKDLPPMSPASLPNCDKALCAPASPLQGRVCACLPADSDGEVTLLVNPGSSPAREVKTAMASFMFEPASFRLVAADFLGTRSDQVLVAALNSQSNGMGVELWSLWIVSKDRITRPLEASDFGTMSFLTTATSGKCEIFVARWRNGWEPGRGAGLYITGHWREATAHGDLINDANRPTWYRRYLPDLERQRNAAMAGPRKTLPWFDSPDARRVVGPFPVE